MDQRPRLVFIVTHAMSANLLVGPQLAYLQREGFEVIVVSSPGADLDIVAQQDGVKTVAVSMRREISPWQDLVALWKLYRVVRRLRPTIVNAGTPKAGLLGMLAAWLARVPIRIYTLRGLRLETARSVKRFVLSITERVASACAHHVVCISQSLRDVYLQQRLTSPQKAIVLGAGSSNGVDVERYCMTSEMRTAIRQSLGRDLGTAHAPVAGFVGRLTRDKGIVELALAFPKILKVVPEARLLLVGDFEQGDAVPEDSAHWLLEHPQVIITSFVADPKPYYGLMDVLAFPSHREGFGNVAVEAASMELPVVGFQVTGVVDAVETGTTGTLVPLGNVDAFVEAVLGYLLDPQLRREHGTAARQRAMNLFRREIVWHAWCEFYLQQLHERGLPLPRPTSGDQAARSKTAANLA